MLNNHVESIVLAFEIDRRDENLNYIFIFNNFVQGRRWARQHEDKVTTPERKIKKEDRHKVFQFSFPI